MELLSLLKLVVSRLEKLKISYVLTGGLAVSFWGLPRTTLEDIESILRISKVDLNYIKKWAKVQSTIKIFDKLTKSKVK